MTLTVITFIIMYKLTCLKQMPQVEIFHTSVVWDVDWDVNVQNIFLHKKIIEFLGI